MTNGNRPPFFASYNVKETTFLFQKSVLPTSLLLVGISDNKENKTETHCSMGSRLTAGRLALNQEIEVRFLIPQPVR